MTFLLEQRGPTVPDADPYDLDRFVQAQAAAFDRALGELRAGEKRSHWMWFVFPQARGLGASPMAVRFGLGSIEEARAYLAHPVLAPRLALCVQAVLAIEGRSLRAIFGSPDDMKFRSSMTLFSLADEGGGGPFGEALDRFCGGAACERTLALMG
ncbi:MAG TPA: DUF1810 domain-containing protein [Hansschlegelia sp.]